MGSIKGGARCSQATWTLAVDGGRRSPKAVASTKAGTPPGGRLLTSVYIDSSLTEFPPPATPWRLPTSAWPRRVILSRGKARQLNLSAQRRDTSRPVGPFASLIMRWAHNVRFAPVVRGAARDGVQGVRPPRLSPRSAAVRRQVLTGQFDWSTSGHRQGIVQSDGSSSPAESGAAHAWPSVLDSFR